MELIIPEKPIMATFTATVPTRVVSDNGSMCANFQAGESKKLHQNFFTAAIAAGLVPEDPLEFKVIQEPEKPGTKEKKLIEACKTLILKADPNDFTVVGQPRAASIKKLVDCRFTNQDVRRAFEEAMHEVDQDGDNDKKHSEPSISTTE